MRRVLLTAFEPFGGEAVNPSQQAARRLAAGLALTGVELSTAYLPVVYGAAVQALRAAADGHDPEVVVCTGLAGGRYGVTPSGSRSTSTTPRSPTTAGRRRSTR